MEAAQVIGLQYLLRPKECGAVFRPCLEMVIFFGDAIDGVCFGQLGMPQVDCCCRHRRAALLAKQFQPHRR